MVKPADLWLRSMLRAGKKQQRTVSRALNALLAQPKSKPKPTPKPRPRVKPAPAQPTARLSLAAPAAATGKWMAFQFAAPNELGAVRRMRYWLYLPNCAPARGGLPLVLMLHGCDQSATLFAQGTRMNQQADKKGFAVLYPQQPVSSHPHRCWKWYDRATQQGGGDVPLIIGILDQVLATYPVNRKRVYIAGMSAGAGMAHIVALNHPEKFAAVGLHSGPLYGAGHSTTGALAVMKHGAAHRVDSAIGEVLVRQPGFPGMPTMLIQGEADPVVRPVNQAQLTRQAMLLNRLPHGARIDLSEKAGHKRLLPHRLHDVYSDSKLMLRVAQIAELKHAWSGGDERLSFNSGAGPDASKMLLEFFAKHRRRV